MTTYKFTDVFNRTRTIDLEREPGGTLLHESGRIYRMSGDEIRLVGSYNHPKFDHPTTYCNWNRRSIPVMFYGQGALLGRVR